MMKKLHTTNKMTVDQVKAEVQILTLENIRSFPCGRSLCEDFYNMWQRFGPQSARDIMIPAIWNSECPLPSVYFNVN